MDPLNREWPAAKPAGPASITMNGASIDDVLSTVQSQMDILHAIVSQQSTYIHELKKRDEEKATDNAKYIERILALENQLKNDAIINIMDRLASHDSNIKELQDRPIIDPEQTERLDAVEKKFASFYGDDTNILGRVQHLENHTKKEKDGLFNAREDIRKLNRSVEETRKALDNMKARDIAEHSRCIKDLRDKKMDYVDIPAQVLDYLKSIDIPVREDISRVKDIVNSLADDWRNSIDSIQHSIGDHMDHILPRLDNHEEELASMKQHGISPKGGSAHHNEKRDENLELVARVSSLESRLARHDISGDRLGKLEDQASQAKTQLKIIESDVEGLRAMEDVSNRDKAKTHSELAHLKSQLDKLEYRMNVIDPLDMEPRSPSRANLAPLVSTPSGRDSWNATGTVDPSVLRELQASVRDLQRASTPQQGVSVDEIERVATKVVKRYQETLGTTQATKSPHANGHSTYDEEDVDRLKDIAKELERRMYVMVEECHKGLETLQKDTSRKMHGMSKYLLESNPPCECHDNLDPTHTSAMGDPLNLLAYRHSRRQCVACSEKDMHTNIPDFKVNSGAKMDQISLLAYRRCRRRCPACVEKERKMGLPDIGGTTIDGDIGERLADLEDKVSKQTEKMLVLKDDNAQLSRAHEEITSNITELKHVVHVDHKNQLDHLQDNKMDSQDIHDMIQAAVRGEHLPSLSDLEAVKNLCSLVASEGRDNLEGLRSKTEKKFKAVATHLGQHDEDLIDLKTASQNAHNHAQTHDERLTSLEGKQGANDVGGGNGDARGLSNSIIKMEQNLTTVLTKLNHQEEEKKKLKGVLEGVKTELTQLQHTVTNEHSPAINQLKKKAKPGKDSPGGNEDTPMDEVIRRAIESVNGKKGQGGVSHEDLDRVKRFVRELERRMFTLADECKEKFDDNDLKMKNLGKFTIEAIRKIVDTINRHPDVYIPSFPEQPHHKPYHFMPMTGGAGSDNRREGLPGLEVHVPTTADSHRWPQRPHSSGEPLQIDDPEEFDEFVRANFDMSKSLPASGFKETSHS